MTDYTSEYAEILQKQLIEICTAKGLLGGTFLTVEELDEVWDKNAPEYLADAVKEVVCYPTVAIAWACYFGMGAGSVWDAAWNTYKELPQLYLFFRDKRGFDCLDEYISEELLGLDAGAAQKQAEAIGDCSTQALSLLRKEQIEPQSVEAYRIFALTAQIFFKLGVSLELHRMGYKYEKVILN